MIPFDSGPCHIAGDLTTLSSERRFNLPSAAAGRTSRSRLIPKITRASDASPRLSNLSVSHFPCLNIPERVALRRSALIHSATEVALARHRLVEASLFRLIPEEETPSVHITLFSRNLPTASFAGYSPTRTLAIPTTTSTLMPPTIRLQATPATLACKLASVLALSALPRRSGPVRPASNPPLFACPSSAFTYQRCATSTRTGQQHTRAERRRGGSSGVFVKEA
ncbi:hypothetical protein MSAN_01325900 [Mycena sanguinolenta]|uniref:Uncharacterized protein n=1 Tax=Mycena sanguinolenta TaxID=230812 RepID=A0A8H6YFG3_9AGAR|nr:hypothetical protein MSAN_01325900 [Mycena sanguinolenta]